MKVLFLGRKPSACKALRFLLENGAQVLGVVAPKVSEEIQGPPFLREEALRLGIPVFDDEEIYSALANPNNNSIDLKNTDWVISFLFWKKIKPALIAVPRRGCLNFHPAPLPDFRGLGGYNIAIYEKMNHWGAAAHFVSEKFDEGDIVESVQFNIESEKETAFSLEQKTQKVLLDLFYKVARNMIADKPLPRIPQTKGRYIDRKEMEALRVISDEDSLDQIQRKIRAYWFAPYAGATIEIKGKSFTVVDENILKEIADSRNKNAEGNRPYDIDSK